jgi:hypothetical protein
MIMTGTPLPGANWLGRLALGCVSLLLLLSPCGPSAAEPPKKGTGDAPPEKKEDGAKKARTVEGVVERFLTGPKGDVHGLVLGDGTEVHFPPHLAKKVGGIVGKKDRVQVKGELHKGPKGDSHLNAKFITNLKSGEAVALGGPKPPKKPKESRTVQGVVERFVTGPKGDVHGLVLSDGTEVRYLPHLAKKVAGIVGKKDRVQVKGELHTGPKGDSHLNAKFITNLKSGEAVALTGPKPPKKEKAEDAGPPKKKGPEDAGPAKKEKAKPKKEARTVQGVVERFLTGPRGEVRGLVLGDGTEVHFPPHLGAKVTGVVGKKDRVQVKGELHKGPKGDSHLNAKFITNLKTSEAVALTGPKPPKKEK